MLQSQILATLKFFDLQDIPLTTFEVYKYMLNDLETIKQSLNERWEVVTTAQHKTEPVTLAAVQSELISASQDPDGPIKNFRGFYFLQHRSEDFVRQRLDSYRFAVKRERRIRKYASYARYLPFIRGCGLVGSQALGKYKERSDIDVLVFTDPSFMWLSRVLITTYFQILGVRRHNKHVADRFCLNHYVAGPKALDRDRNIYTASEYVKMRPLWSSVMLEQFKKQNLSWIQLFFPNVTGYDYPLAPQPRLQKLFEGILNNQAGKIIEQKFKNLLTGRITQDDFVVVGQDELSFHPHNRKVNLFSAFFKD